MTDCKDKWKSSKYQWRCLGLANEREREKERIKEKPYMSENTFFSSKECKWERCESNLCWACYELEIGTWAKRGDNQTHTLWKIVCGNFCCSKIRSIRQCETGIVSPCFFTSLWLFRVGQQWQDDGYLHLKNRVWKCIQVCKAKDNQRDVLSTSEQSLDN